MKKPYLFLLWVTIAAGCGNKDKILVTQVPSDLIVNPDTRVLIKNNHLLYARLDSGNSIHGITANNVFITTDLFKHFGVAADALPFATMPYSVNKHSIVLASGSPLSPVLNYSTDDGFSWTSFTPSLMPALSTTGFSTTKLTSVGYIDAQNLLMLYLQQSSATGLYTRTLYKINTVTKQGSVLSSTQDNYQPLIMKFADTKNGWISLNYTGTSITATTDGGSTWSTPKLIDAVSLPLLELGSAGTLAIYEVNGNAWFSANGGNTWKKTGATNRFSNICFAGSSTVFGLTGTGVVKSSDNGTTWSIASNFGNGIDNVQNLFFLDEQQGIAYADQRLFATADGGKSWTTLLYPYPYIIQ